MSNKGMKIERFGNHKNVVALIRALLGGPMSLKEVCAKTSVSYDVVRPLIKRLHAEGLMHISHWQIDSRGRQSVAVYALGLGVDAPKRKPKTGAQRSLAYIRRRQSAQEREQFGAMGIVGRISNTTLDTALAGWR